MPTSLDRPRQGPARSRQCALAGFLAPAGVALVVAWLGGCAGSTATPGADVPDGPRDGGPAELPPADLPPRGADVPAPGDGGGDAADTPQPPPDAALDAPADASAPDGSGDAPGDGPPVDIAADAPAPDAPGDAPGDGPPATDAADAADATDAANDGADAPAPDAGCPPRDECALGEAACAPEALCADTPCGYLCTCLPGYAGDGFTCTPHCANGTRDGDETGPDCGGACPPCGDWLPCLGDDDCQNGPCTAFVCQPACFEYYGACLQTFRFFGQPNYRETMQNQPTGHSVYHAGGVLVDRSVQPNRVYVIDAGDSRVLGFASLGTCAAESDRPCTGDGDCAAGDPCLVDPQRDADLIFGQPDAMSGTCNGDNNWGHMRPPTAETLCLMNYPLGTNVSEQWRSNNFEVDATGNFYLMDVYNNRVLRYNDPFSPDPSDGRGDTRADVVWGQRDFNTNGINRGRGVGRPDAGSLYVSFLFHGATRGVSVDAAGNLWVADAGNSRVLRFPPGATAADLVLGQPDFSSWRERCSFEADWAPLDRMCHPTLARIRPDTGQLYVIDQDDAVYDGVSHFGAARILVFDPPFASGMSAFRALRPDVGGPFLPAGVDYYFTAATLVFNPWRQGAYADGLFWVTEQYPGQRASLIGENGDFVAVLFARDENEQGGETAYYRYWPDMPCGAPGESGNVQWANGIVGFDADRHIYVADEHLPTSHIARYSLPYLLQPRTVDGETYACFPPPDTTLVGRHAITDARFTESIGVLPYRGQLLAKDWERLLVFDDYAAKPHGAAADRVLALPGPKSFFAVDAAERIWTFEHLGPLRAYAAPLRAADTEPLLRDVKLFWDDDGTELTMGDGYWTGGVAFDPVGGRLWMSDWRAHRVLRLRPDAAMPDRLIIDLVIGQPDKQTTACNHDQFDTWNATGPAAADGLCDPHAIRFDRLGNLYVVESDYECHGNNRVSVFMAADIAAAEGLFPQVAARKVFIAQALDQELVCEPAAGERAVPVAVAFNSRNELVIGLDGYNGLPEERHLRQLMYFADPLQQDAHGFVQGQPPDAFIEVPIGAVGDLWFDEQDRLVVQDYTWPRIWVIDVHETGPDGTPRWLVPNAGARAMPQTAGKPSDRGAATRRVGAKGRERAADGGIGHTVGHAEVARAAKTRAGHHEHAVGGEPPTERAVVGVGRAHP